MHVRVSPRPTQLFNYIQLLIKARRKWCRDREEVKTIKVYTPRLDIRRAFRPANYQTSRMRISRFAHAHSVDDFLCRVLSKQCICFVFSVSAAWAGLAGERPVYA